MNRSLRGLLIAGALALPAFWTAPLFAADADEDPDAGQSRLLSLAASTIRDRHVVSGSLRATDDFGATRDRDFRIDVDGYIEQDNRRVLLLRREPECAGLALAAQLKPDAFCDRLLLSHGRERSTLRFSSFDANRVYTFDLVERGSGTWQSQAPSGVRAPQLTVSTSGDGDSVAYRVTLEGARHTYSQILAIGESDLRRSGLDTLEGALIPIGDVLRSFNAWEFELADLPRDHSDYEPTPYLGWDEQPVEGGCIFLFCFGNIGGGGSGSGNNNQDVCDPRSDIYDPDQCPWDLTYATWPVSQRVKIWKVNNDQVGYSFYVKNDEDGRFKGSETSASGASLLTFASLIKLDALTPLVTPGSEPYGEFCYKAENLLSYGTGDPFNGTNDFTLDPHAVAHTNFDSMLCPGFSGRPAGRYRLYLHIDPEGVFDYPGNAGNNKGNSGAADWVHLKR